MCGWCCPEHADVDFRVLTDTSGGMRGSRGLRWEIVRRQGAGNIGWWRCVDELFFFPFHPQFSKRKLLQIKSYDDFGGVSLTPLFWDSSCLTVIEHLAAQAGTGAEGALVLPSCSTTSHSHDRAGNAPFQPVLSNLRVLPHVAIPGRLFIYTQIQSAAPPRKGGLSLL